MLPTEFVLFSDHQALRYLNSQKKLNARHDKWVEFLNEYSFMINYCAGIENKAADAVGPLSRPNPFCWIRTESGMPCYHPITQNHIFTEVISKLGKPINI